MDGSLRLPERIARRIGGLNITENTVGRSDTQVFQAGGMHLKIGSLGALERAANMQEYFHAKGLSSALLDYVQQDGRDWLLTETVPGVPAYDMSLRGDMPRLARRLGEILRMLHETDAADCPLDDANQLALDAYQADCAHPFEGNIGLLQKDVLLHGDACLPNLLLDGDRFCGFIDLGESGLGDRHFDLYWMLWSMQYNFQTTEYHDIFLNAYGRDVVQADRLELCTQICRGNG